MTCELSSCHELNYFQDGVRLTCSFLVLIEYHWISCKTFPCSSSIIAWGQLSPLNKQTHYKHNHIIYIQSSLLVDKYISININKCIRFADYIHSYLPMYIYTHIVHTLIHPFIHTYIHTYIQNPYTYTIYLRVANLSFPGQSSGGWTGSPNTIVKRGI